MDLTFDILRTTVTGLLWGQWNQDKKAATVGWGVIDRRALSEGTHDKRENKRKPPEWSQWLSKITKVSIEKISLVLVLRGLYRELGMLDCTVLFPFYGLKFLKKECFTCVFLELVNEWTSLFKYLSFSKPLSHWSVAIRGRLKIWQWIDHS